MYSEIVSSDAMQKMLESIVIFGVIAAVVGTVFYLFWKQIIFGGMALLCLVVLANHKPSNPTVPEVKVEVPVEVKDEVKDPEPVEVKKPEEKQELVDDKTMFMEDCLFMTDYTEQKCEDVWNKRGSAFEDVPEEIEKLEIKYKKRSKLKHHI